MFLCAPAAFSLRHHHLQQMFQDLLAEEAPTWKISKMSSCICSRQRPRSCCHSASFKHRLLGLIRCDHHFIPHPPQSSYFIFSTQARSMQIVGTDRGNKGKKKAPVQMQIILVITVIINMSGAVLWHTTRTPRRSRWCWRLASRPRRVLTSRQQILSPYTC